MREVCWTEKETTNLALLQLHTLTFQATLGRTDVSECLSSKHLPSLNETLSPPPLLPTHLYPLHPHNSRLCLSCFLCSVEGDGL